MRIWTAILAAAVLGTAGASGRIGETMAQCKARYGKPVSEAKGTFRFEKAGFLICAWFDGDRCDRITFDKIKKDRNGMFETFAEAEIQTLLAANSGGKDWRDVSRASDYYKWQTDGGERIAETDGNRRGLVIYTASYTAREEKRYKAEREKQAREETERLKGF